MQTWEQVALGAIILVIMIWQFPKISGALKAGQDAPKDWAGFLVPIVGVVVFVFILIKLA